MGHIERGWTRPGATPCLIYSEETKVLEHLHIALVNISSLQNLFLMTMGVICGAIAGCIPGLTATMAIALVVPFTFTMDPATGLITLGGIYTGAIYGGCISAILVNTPGTPANIATTFDGYPMTRKGQAQSALVTAAYASAIGGVIGTAGLLLFSPLLAAAALKFGPPEYFWLAIFGLTIIASVSAESLLKGIIGGMLGLLLSTIGIAPLGGTPRFTFDMYQLQAGVDIIVALIGFFCIPEVFNMVEHRAKRYRVAEYQSRKGVTWETIKAVTRKPVLVIRSAVIGAFVGAVPGAGGNIAGMLSYGEARRWSKEPEKFGTGVVEGVCASEAANNAEVPGSLVPLLALGIPGAPPAAVLLGALLLQGIRPGPELYTTYGGITYSFIFSLFLANLLLIPVGIYGSKAMARVITSPVNYLIPLILFFSVIGSFAIHNNLVEVYIMAFFGVVGYITKKMGFHAGPIVLGLILGPFAENGLVQSMLMGKASGSIFKVFFTRPISIILIIICLLSMAWPVVTAIAKKRRERRAMPQGGLPEEVALNVKAKP